MPNTFTDITPVMELKLMAMQPCRHRATASYYSDGCAATMPAVFVAWEIRYAKLCSDALQ
jgi:hypothetical protein